MGCAASGAAPQIKDPPTKGKQDDTAPLPQLNAIKEKRKSSAKLFIAAPKSKPEPEPEPEPEPLRPKEEGMKIIYLVDPFLNRQCEVEIWRDDAEKPGRIDLYKGLKAVFPGKSRDPKYLLVRGREVPLSKTPIEIYHMIEHGGFYDIGFMTGM